MPVLHLRYEVGVDGISLFLVLLTAFLMPLAILASWRIERNVRLFMAAMLILETAVLGSFLALDLLLFFLFFEALLFPMYLIIGGWGYERRIYAAVKFFLFTMAGSALLFVGILFLFSRSGDLPGGPTFDLLRLQDVQLSATAGRWLFLAFFIAFAVKVPLFPLHTWLPDAHTEAPTAGSVLLAGVLLKVGAYGLIRFNLSLFPEASAYFADVVSILAVIGIIYGSVVALMQSDLKRLVAYSSVAHLGFVVLGIFAFTDQGASGGVLQMVNHGLSTGGLFLHRGDAVRAHAYSRARGARRPRPGDAVARRDVPRDGALLDRAPGAEQLRRGVPRHPRDADLEPRLRRPGLGRRRAERRLPLVVVSAGDAWGAARAAPRAPGRLGPRGRDPGARARPPARVRAAAEPPARADQPLDDRRRRARSR